MAGADQQCAAQRREQRRALPINSLNQVCP